MNFSSLKRYLTLYNAIFAACVLFFAAMLAYAASEDPDRTPRTRAILPPGRSGQPRSWPTCSPAQRNPPAPR